MPSEKRRMQNVLRMFLDPLLDALGKLGTNAYMPVLKTDRCLQLLVELLHACASKGPSAQDGKRSGFSGPLLGIPLACRTKGSSRPFQTERLPHAFSRCVLVSPGGPGTQLGRSTVLPTRSGQSRVYVCWLLLILECDFICCYFFLIYACSLVFSPLEMITMSRMFKQDAFLIASRLLQKAR